MKGTSWSAAVALGLIATIVASCATSPQTSQQPGQHLAPTEARKAGKKGPCEWTYELGLDTKKIDKESLKLSEGSGPKGCMVRHYGPPLYIGADASKGMKVRDIGAVELHTDAPAEGGSRESITAGFCNYCYMNSAGGMTCVRYPC
jgi:hypothetical protein